ncbi:MAG: S-methyl-5'-thioadenosine phosphorylase [Syntrophomonadaceae bacterium]|nr:S-methyl-5'-thioadenosine phosphorylase [Syntrophomonadaceae bacterium]
MPRFAIIGGTGVYDPQLLDDTRLEKIVTPYGEVAVQVGVYRGMEIAFIPRHGGDHSVPPHLINYRANLKALQQVGVENIIATAAVGSLNIDMQPGHFVLCDQFLDFTKGRITSYFNGGEDGVKHCDMTQPYCPALREAIVRSGEEKGQTVHRDGCYVCSEGPRFETAAEVRMFRMLGGDVAGMTGVPEVCMARELGICYANVSIVTNMAAGIGTRQLTHAEVLQSMSRSIGQVRSLVMDSFTYVDAIAPCTCALWMAAKEETDGAQ